MEHIHIKVDEKIKQAVKVKAAKENTSITVVVIRLLRQWLRGENK